MIILECHQDLLNGIEAAWDAIELLHHVVGRHHGAVHGLTEHGQERPVGRLERDHRRREDGVERDQVLVRRSWWTDLDGAWRTATGKLGSLLSGAWSGIKSTAVSAWDGIAGAFSKVWDTITAGFRKAVVCPVRHLGRAEERPRRTVELDRLPRVRPREHIWDAIAKVIPGMSAIKFSSGGIVPGPGTGDVVPALLEPGETVVDKGRSRMLAPAFKAAGVPGYAGGGIIGGIGGVLGDVGHVVGDILGGLTDPGKVLEKLLSFGGITSTPAAKLIEKIPEAAVKDMAGAIGKAVSSFGGGGSGPGGRLHLSGSGATVEALMKSMAASVGWTGAQWQDLYNVEMREAGFNLHAHEPVQRRLRPGAVHQRAARVRPVRR